MSEARHTVGSSILSSLGLGSGFGAGLGSGLGAGISVALGLVAWHRSVLADFWRKSRPLSAR
jgi:hypothetical protein